MGREASSWFFGYGSQREALAAGQSRWSLWEPCLYASAGAGLRWVLTSTWHLFLLLPPYVKEILAHVSTFGLFWPEAMFAMAGVM